MGQRCSTFACGHVVDAQSATMSRNDSPDPAMYDLMRKSIAATSPFQPPPPPHQSPLQKRWPLGQHHLLYRHSKGDPCEVLHHHHQQSSSSSSFAPTTGKTTLKVPNWLPEDTPVQCPTRLLIRQRSPKLSDEGAATHIYAIRYPEDTMDQMVLEQSIPPLESARQEQCPEHLRRDRGMALQALPQAPPRPVSQAPHLMARMTTTTTTTTTTRSSSTTKKSDAGGRPLPSGTNLGGGDVFSAAAMASIPRQTVMDWVTISEEHQVYVADVGLTGAQCDHIVNTTEQVCKGQYAAYTYAKQTLGCREFPILAQTSFPPVHTITSDILRRLGAPKADEPTPKSTFLQLDDREPHIVKYDVTKKERQKLDMHTDKSEWTFLIALSNGCGVDYEGGGTYFECLDATIHIQRGHALVFPGKLRHCGQKITSGLRFLLVGFLVDKSTNQNTEGTKGLPRPPSPPGNLPAR